MNLNRPDLTGVDPAIRAYIEALEAELEQRRGGKSPSLPEAMPPEPSEPPTTVALFTVSTAGLAKRTPRHLYSRQRRGGMGIFDLETGTDDPPAFLALADVQQTLLLVTSLGRVFRLPVSEWPEAPVRARGVTLAGRFTLRSDERFVAALPDQGGAFLALLTGRGWVDRVKASFLGPTMTPGTVFHDAKLGGAVVNACWTPGDAELFVATRQGLAIRFAERLVPASGCLGIRLERDDVAVAVTAVRPDSGVFLLSADGQGTIRLMEGFAANKAPGSGGKVAIKAAPVVAAVTVEEGDDLFVISRLSKLIRFPAAEVPAKAGPVQGVACMALRADQAVAVAVAR